MYLTMDLYKTIRKVLVQINKKELYFISWQNFTNKYKQRSKKHLNGAYHH